jgi:hypothetical protein
MTLDTSTLRPSLKLYPSMICVAGNKAWASQPAAFAAGMDDGFPLKTGGARAHMTQSTAAPTSRGVPFSRVALKPGAVHREPPGETPASAEIEELIAHP